MKRVLVDLIHLIVSSLVRSGLVCVCLEWEGVEHRQRGACVSGRAFRVQSVGFRVWGGLRVEGSGLRV